MRLAVMTLFALLAFASPAYASSVSNLKVDNHSPSSGAGARTQYLITFDTSNKGNLAVGSTIDVTFPDDTSFAGASGGNVYDGATRIGSCPTPDANTRKSTCSIFPPIAASTTAPVEFYGVTNPTQPTHPTTTHTGNRATHSDTPRH